MEPHMDKYLGKKLEGRYEIQDLIGMGGMANVYRAFDVIDQRTVSVKILRDEYLGNTEFLRRFKNESKAIAVLSHPNIVQVYDVSFTSRYQSIVMEYIDGITLKDYFERQGGPIKWNDAVHLTLQVLRALEHAHEKGIVHRDIKPHNIMLLRDGTIKVTDFGIARFARSEVKTITDRAIGSVHYISPEQAMGDNTDQKSDVYSVGVLLFEMLTGKVPFEADTAVSVAIKHIQSRAVRPTAINPDIPKGLEEITLRAMEKDASVRYQSAAAMINDIEKFQADPSISFQYKYMSGRRSQAARQKYRRADDRSREENPLRNQRRKKRVPYLPILAGVTFAFMVAAGAFLWLMVSLQNPFAQVEEVRVPNLVGLRFETALSQYADLNVRIEQAEVAYHSEFPPGVIFYQDPRAGRSIREDGVIRVNVSGGQAVIPSLENFENQTVDRATRRLLDLGLEYEIVRQHDSNVFAGHVIRTNPSAGAEVRAGSTVTVYVSLGPDVVMRDVPDVTGMPIAQARQMLELFSLRVGYVTYEQSEQPADTVIAQDPASGESHPEGTAVNLVVSRGADTTRVAIAVPMPNLDDYATLQAFQDGQLVFQEVLNPAEIGTWRPFFSGEGELAFIEIFINDQLWRHYQLDFSNNPPTYQELRQGTFFG